MPDTTPGRDDWSYELFKHLVLEEILSLFTSVRAKGCLPADWKHAVRVQISKPSKNAPNPSSY